MIVQRPQSLALVAAHDRGIACDIAEHDRGKLARRICARRPARIGHLRFPASMPRYHGGRKAEHLGPFVALFEKGCAVFAAIQRLYRMRATKSSRIFVYFVDSLAPATNA